ncbi:Cytochrome b reductase 1-like [Homarus americanus]|uniref:Cytochrome b reductase 1-like n=1 Tax=Homarus americanus TaxID=6706 RepID=A0A8J5TK74_HOMAM|nr:Cytochrome b reductase 1-like [Homarus americanus]
MQKQTYWPSTGTNNHLLQYCVAQPAAISTCIFHIILTMTEREKEICQLSMLVYRLFRCCNKLTAKILHTFLYLMAVPCIVVGTITVFDSHNLNDPPIPNLYSLHSWLGVVTIGLFALQLVVGFFSFWLLLCCEQGTARFRAGLVPIHATFGIITFMLAIATAVTGYTEKAFFALRDPQTNEILYSRMENEAIVINTQAAALAALGILVPIMVALRPFRRRWSERLTEHL